MIKGNESLVENVNFNFLTPLSHNFKMLHFDAKPIQIGYLVTEFDEGFDNAKNNIQQRNLNTVFANISKITWPTSDSFLLIMSNLFNPNGYWCTSSPTWNLRVTKILIEFV